LGWDWSVPFQVVLLAAAVLLGVVLSWRLSISNRLERVRVELAKGNKVLPSTPTLRVARLLRKSGRLAATWWWLSERFVPIVVVLVFGVCVLASVYHLAYLAESASGTYCVESPASTNTDGIAGERRVRQRDGFKTSEVCWASGIGVTKGFTYVVELESNG